MNSRQAIATILGLLNDDDVAIFTTGMISRQAFNIKDRKANLYIIGSMGLVSCLGLGIGLNTAKRVVIFDGDGSLLMNMGAMAMIGAESPRNILHIVLDNQCYQSTGGQPTISKDIDLTATARASGYKHVYRIDRDQELAGIFSRAIKEAGPAFLLLKVEPENLKNIGRVSLSPEELKQRIMEVIC